MTTKEFADKWGASVTEVRRACRWIAGASKTNNKWSIPVDARMVYVPPGKPSKGVSLYVVLLDAICRRWDVCAERLGIPDEGTLQSYLQELCDSRLIRLKKGRAEGTGALDYILTINGEEWRTSKQRAKQKVVTDALSKIASEVAAAVTNVAMAKIGLGT